MTTSFRQGTELMSLQVVDFDPTIGDGVSGATPFLLLIRTDIPSLYYFEGPLDTDWVLFNDTIIAGVTVDGTTIGGNGAGVPLHTIPDGTAVLSDGTSIAGNGVTGTPLHTVAGGTAIVTDTTMTGNGLTATPLSGIRNQFQPAGELFVAKSWPIGFNPTVFFTTITAALATIPAAPPSTSPIIVEVAPGTYNESFSGISNVSIVGKVPESVILNGNITWDAGTGVNLGQAALQEVFQVSNILASVATNSFTTDTTAKSAGTAVVSCDRFSFAIVSMTGKNNGNDEVFLWNCNFLFGAAAATFTGITGPILPNNEGVSIVGNRFRGINFVNCTVRIEGGEQVLRVGSTIALTGTTIFTMQGCDVVNPLSAAAGCTCVITGSGIVATGLLSGAGTFDIRSSTYAANANIAGITGTCNRSSWNGSVTTVTGANVVTPNPPYPAGAYTVLFEPSPGVANLTVSAKTGPNFGLNDPGAGATYNYNIQATG